MAAFSRSDLKEGLFAIVDRKKHYVEQFPVQVKINSMDTVMQAILLAAGYGTRLRPYTDLRPKPLFPVLNQPLLTRLVLQLRDHGCHRLVVNCHHLADQVRAALAPWPEIILLHEPEILGTGGTLRRALEHLVDDPVLVVNGDLYHQIDLEQVYHRHLMSKNEVTLALHHHPRFNTVAVAGDRVRGFETPPEEGLAFTGIHVIDPEAIERIPVQGFFHIIDLYRELAREDKVGSCRVDGACWRDIGTPADYLQLHAELLREQPGGWVIDPTARIGAGVVLADWGAIGAGAEIGEGARLSRCVVWDGARVQGGRLYADAILTGDAGLDTLQNQTGAGRG